MTQALAGFPAEEVALGRKRIADGAAFFGAKFPGWQGRIIEAGGMLNIRLYDYCPAAIAAKGCRGPRGQFLATHGDVVLAYLDEFHSVSMGCSSDALVRCDVLDLCWKEAARA